MSSDVVSFAPGPLDLVYEHYWPESCKDPELLIAYHESDQRRVAFPLHSTYPHCIKRWRLSQHTPPRTAHESQTQFIHA